MTNEQHPHLFTVTDDSMSPRFRPGEKLVFDPSLHLDQEADCVVRLKGGEAKVRTVFLRGQGQIVLRCFDPQVEDEVHRLDDFALIAPVVRFYTLAGLS
ncbi:S24 family peptidase [Nitrospinae bacterium AH_259_B05_G02_I21]|nr:S24 family peptidase [Nitrospinae bacterium AH_259_B05_G02_I21]MDA2932422.1 S24 family peptidase [Nitrospinae bacterium AH-259-F20]